MCPICATNMVVMAAGATSTGGLTVLALKKFVSNITAKTTKPVFVSKGGQENEPTEHCITN